MLKAKDFRKIARESLKGNWPLAIGTGFLSILFGATIFYGGTTMNLDLNNDAGEQMVQHIQTVIAAPTLKNILMAIVGVLSVFLIVYSLITLIIGGAISLGYAKFNLNLINRNNPKVEDLFSQMNRYKAGFVMRFFRGLYILIGLLLLVVPGFIALYAYSMAPYILYENPDMTGREALKASKELMKGNKWRLFCLGFSFIGWNILCSFTLGIGGLLLHPYQEAAGAAFYREIKWENMKHQVGME